MLCNVQIPLESEKQVKNPWHSEEILHGLENTGEGSCWFIRSSKVSPSTVPTTVLTCTQYTENRMRTLLGGSSVDVCQHCASCRNTSITHLIPSLGSRKAHIMMPILQVIRCTMFVTNPCFLQWSLTCFLELQTVSSPCFTFIANQENFKDL